jgi:hypothetical protein
VRERRFTTWKTAYYDALAAYDALEDLEPMLEFLKQQAEKTWEKQLEREERRKNKLETRLTET